MSGRKMSSGKLKVGENRDKKRQGLVQLCYGGYFTNHSIDGPEYHEGKVSVEMLVVDDISISGLLGKLKELGYSNIIKMHYQKGTSLIKFAGLVLLGDDVAESRLRIMLCKYGSVTIFVEHGDVDQNLGVGVGQNLGVTIDEERGDTELVGQNLGGPINEGESGCSYPQGEGQNGTFNEGVGSVQEVGFGAEKNQQEDDLVRATADLNICETEIPAPPTLSEATEFVQVPVNDAQTKTTTQLRTAAKNTTRADVDSDLEEPPTGEGATLLVQEVHFADSDSHNEEVELARETVKKWRKRKKQARKYESSDEEERCEEQVQRDIVEAEVSQGSDRDSIYHSSDSEWSVRSRSSKSEGEYDEAERVKLKWPQYDPDQPFLDFCKHMGFTGPTEFKDALSRYAINKQCDFRLTKDKVSAECKGKAGDDGPKCPWRVYASWQKTDAVFRVKKYNNHHQCNPAYKNRRITAGVIAKHFKKRIDENPELKSWQLQRIVKNHIKCEAKLSKCIRAKRMYAEATLKNELDEFGRLWSYVDELANFSVLHMCQGLMNAIQTEVPNVQQRMCARHIYANWRKKHRGKDLKKRFWASSKTTYFENFRRLMYDMALSMSASAYEDLTNLDPKHWARAMFPIDVKCENVDNNMCESFNAIIIEARHKSIITLMEHLRLYVAKRMREKRLGGEKWAFEYGPRIQKRLNKSRDLAAEWNVVFKSDRGYEVEGFDAKKHVVKLNEMSCTCRRWDITGIPCAHAVCAIQYEGRDAGNYLSGCYSRAMYLRSYSYQLEPIRGPEFWPTVNKKQLLPPEIRSLPGRKKKKRRLEEHERSGKNSTQTKIKEKATRQMTCGWCKALHHNKRGCPDRAHYLALEAAQKAQRGQQEVQENGDDISMSQPPSQEATQEHLAPHGQTEEEAIHQQQATEEFVVDLDDRNHWQLTITESAPVASPTTMAPTRPITSGSDARTGVVPITNLPLPRPLWQPPRPLWGKPPTTFPRRVTSMGLYQNSTTGVAILDPGKHTQTVISEPASIGSETKTSTTKKKSTATKKKVPSASKIWRP